MNEHERRARSERRVGLFFGWLLLLVGLVVGILTGTCVAAFSSEPAMAALAWAIGGLPLIFAAICVVAGLAILIPRLRRPPPPPMHVFDEEPRD